MRAKASAFSANEFVSSVAKLNKFVVARNSKSAEDSAADTNWSSG
jgi:hypothetical protein